MAARLVQHYNFGRASYRARNGVVVGTGKGHGEARGGTPGGRAREGPGEEQGGWAHGGPRRGRAQSPVGPMLPPFL